MKALNGLHRDPPSRAQSERLARWLHEWQVEDALREPSETAGPPAPVEAGNRCRIDLGGLAADPARDPAPAAGQVRLLSPLLTDTIEWPLYVALLCRESYGFVLAPFGRFSEPAVPGELLSGRDTPALRVLCLWNARVPPARALRLSWVVDRLSGEESALFVAAWRHVRAHARPPPGLEDRTGPPLRHPDDPRHDYLAVEQGVMDRVMSAMAQVERAARVDLYPERDDSVELPRAADPGEDYDVPGDGKRG